MDENAFSIFFEDILKLHECNDIKSSKLLEFYFNQTAEGQKIINEMSFIICGYKLESLLEK